MTRRAPAPIIVARALTQAATTTEHHGEQARTMAHLLATRGYPTATLGNGSRTSDPTSSTERAVLTPNPWADVDDELARLERILWSAATRYTDLTTRILAHAPDDDPIPAGRGNCRRCDTFCKGDGGNDRLRYGSLCHPCSSALRRYRATHPQATVDDFIRATKETAA